MSRIIGIDFGTTKTLVSWINPKTNQAELVRLGQQGTDKIPTSIYIETNGDFLFGEDADDQMQFDAIRYKRAFKLELGSTDPSITVAIDGKNKSFLSWELTGQFLGYVKRRCEEEVFLGEKVTGAIITIPVSFSPAQKRDLEKAAKSAGYTDVILLPEPEAAGLAFVNNNPTDKFKSMMIVDWGGGTVDFAQVSQNSQGEIHANADSFDGDETLGGEVFDELLWQYAMKKISSSDAKGRNPGEEPLEVINTMLKQVRLCKERLSKTPQSRLVLAGRTGPYLTNVLQSEFSDLITKDVENIAIKLEKLLQKIYKRENKLPEALLMIGGSSSIPVIQRILTKKSGLKCISWQYAHEAVAIGAAIYANKIQHSQSTDHTTKEQVIKCPVCYQKLRSSSGKNKLRCPKCSAIFTISEKSTPSLEELINDTSKLHDIKKAAENGNTAAESLLGILYTEGIIVDLDFDKGYEYSKKAADFGDVFALFYLAVDFYRGRGVYQDKKKANEIFSKIYNPLYTGAKNGNPLAQYTMGYMYQNGITVSRDEKIAVRWFEESAKKNNLLAMYALANCYDDGKGITSNIELAYQLYKNVAEKGLYAAYGDLYRLDLKNCKSDIDIKNALEYLTRAEAHGVYWVSLDKIESYVESGEIKKAEKYAKSYINLAKKDAEKGYDLSQLYLGVVYKNGWGIEQDFHEAFKWYAKAAEQNNIKAMLALARCYLLGQGTEVNGEVAFNILQLPEVQCDPEAAFYLYLCYLDGLGTEPDLEKSMYYLRKSASNHYEKAMILLGRYYLYGENVIKNEKEAFRLFSAVGEDNPDANYWIGICYRDGLGVPRSCKTANKYFKRAADQNNADAMVELALSYASGIGVKKNPHRTFELLSHAAKQEHPEGLLYLGYCYTFEIGTLKSSEDAIICFKKSADLQEPEAIAALFTEYGDFYSKKERKLAEKMLNIISNNSFVKNNPHCLLQSQIYNDAVEKYPYNIPQQTCLLFFDCSNYSYEVDEFLITYKGILGYNHETENIIAFEWEDIEKIEYSSNGFVSLIHDGNRYNIRVPSGAQSLTKMISDLQSCFIYYFHNIGNEVV